MTEVGAFIIGDMPLYLGDTVFAWIIYPVSAYYDVL